MTTFKTGDVVICKKYEVAKRTRIDSKGVRAENYIDDSYFNREAVIEHTYKEYMQEYFKDGSHDECKDLDEYGIRFLDNNQTLAWVCADELVLKYPADGLLNMMFKGKESEDNNANKQPQT